MSTAPNPLVWMWEPPSSSLSTFRPRAGSTTGGPATKSWAVFLGMTEKWEKTTRAAPSPATDPRAALTTGTVERSSSIISMAGLAGT